MPLSIKLSVPYYLLYVPLNYIIYFFRTVLGRHFTSAVDHQQAQLLQTHSILTSIPLWRFDESTHQWEIFKLTNDNTYELSQSLRVVTFNVLYNDLKYMDWISCTDERWDFQLRQFLMELDADVICLNEVSKHFLALLLNTTWIKESYWVSDISEDHFSPRGNLILSRLPCSQLYRESYHNMKHPRPAIIARFELYNSTETPHGMAVSSVHLSAREEGYKIRQLEIEHLCKALHTSFHENDSLLLLGDLNLHLSLEEQFLPQNWVDVWSELHPNDPGYTLDARRNAMVPLLYPHQTRTAMRLDRMWFFPGTDINRVRPSSIRMIANQPLMAAPLRGGVIFLSDHFGLQAEFESVDNKVG